MFSLSLIDKKKWNEYQRVYSYLRNPISKGKSTLVSPNVLKLKISREMRVILDHLSNYSTLNLSGVS